MSEVEPSATQQSGTLKTDAAADPRSRSATPPREEPPAPSKISNAFWPHGSLAK